MYIYTGAYKRKAGFMHLLLQNEGEIHRQADGRTDGRVDDRRYGYYKQAVPRTRLHMNTPDGSLFILFN